MKRTVLLVISLVLAVSLVLAAPAKVQAFDWTPPVVTPVFGDSDFSAVPTAVSKLPGIVPNDNGLILPTGFPEGTAQFGGDGLVVKDLTQGSVVKVCFSLPPAKTEWTGSVHQWNGSNWIKLATTVSQAGDEASVATACTEIYGDGTYALILGYTGAPESNGLPVCTDLEINTWMYISFSPSFPGNPHHQWAHMFMNVTVNKQLPVGTPVGLSIFGFTPSTALRGAINRTTSVAASSEYGSSMLFGWTPESLATFPLTEFILSDSPLESIPFTFRVILPDCYKDFSNPFANPDAFRIPAGEINLSLWSLPR